MTNQWQIPRACEKPHSIVYRGAKENGAFVIVVDGNYQEIQAVDNKAEFVLDGARCYISVLPGSLRGDLFVNDALQPYSDEQIPLDTNTSAPAGSAKKGFSADERKHSGSFLSFVLFSLINIALALVGTTMYFPFSSAVAFMAAVTGKEFLIEGNTGTGIVLFIIALAVAGLFYLLYVLSKTRRSCVLIALTLVIMDLGVVILLYLDNIASGIIDIAFHAWVIYALVRLFQAKKPKQGADISPDSFS